MLSFVFFTNLLSHCYFKIVLAGKRFRRLQIMPRTDMDAAVVVGGSLFCSIFTGRLRLPQAARSRALAGGTVGLSRF